jgi:electron transport complex protein RnfG
MKEHLKTAILLAFICLIAAGSLGYFYQLTNPIIVQQQINAKIMIKKELLPQATEFKDIKVEDKEVSIGINSGKIVGGVITLGVKGYGGLIDMVIGADSNGKVTGVRILSHSETPGLGERATKESYLSQFIGKDQENLDTAPLITGATISSKAIKNGVKEGISIISEAMKE